MCTQKKLVRSCAGVAGSWWVKKVVVAAYMPSLPCACMPVWRVRLRTHGHDSMLIVCVRAWVQAGESRAHEMLAAYVEKDDYVSKHIKMDADSALR